jgi:hypothetical protein
MRADLEMARLAEQQLGLLTHRQALAGGLTRNQVEYRARSGRWTRLHPGVYLVAGAVRSPQVDMLAAVLAVGGDALVSHASAAALHGFELVPFSQAVEVSTSAPHQRTLRRVTVHRTAVLRDLDRVLVGPIPVTSIERTLVDCSGGYSLGQLARVMDAQLVSRKTTLRALRTSASELPPAPGRRSLNVWKLLEERGVEADTAESRPEMRMHRVLLASTLPPPVAQYWVTVRGEPFRLDLAYPEAKLGLEYLGFDPHRSRSSFDADFRRDRLLKTIGWEVVYFTSATSDAEILRTVAELLDRLRPHPE